MAGTAIAAELLKSARVLPSDVYARARASKSLVPRLDLVDKVLLLRRVVVVELR
jgi:hypothetical protein